MAIPALLKELAVAAGRAAVDAIVKLVRGKARDGWVDVKVTDPPQPLSYKDVEHQQAQIRSATQPPVDRSAITSRPSRPKPGTLPRK